jgi:hypothetical protein
VTVEIEDAGGMERESALEMECFGWGVSFAFINAGCNGGRAAKPARPDAESGQMSERQASGGGKLPRPLQSGRGS